MEWLSPLLLTVQVLSSVGIIVLVLLQQGKGADMGSAFGSGSAGSLFGASGAANFLSRTTKWAAVVFFASTAGLAWIAHKPQQEAAQVKGGVMQNYQADPSIPSVPGSAVPAAPNSVPSNTIPAVPVAPAATDQSSAPAASAASPAEKAPAQPSNAEVPAAPSAGGQGAK
jgi:preprotein translocase subunit SecG